MKDVALRWFKSYLSQRKQFVSFNNAVSPFSVITHGVPQGSILGPVLFNIYINDIVKASETLKCSLFADDSCFYFSNSDTNYLQVTCNNELAKVKEWITCNKLTLNILKSNFVIFSRRKTQITDFNLQISNMNLERKYNVTFLGVELDDKLSWKPHIENLLNKLNKYKSIIYLIRRNFDEYSLKLIYFSIIYSRIIYCIVLWGGSMKSHLQKINVVHKGIIRTICYKNRRHHSDPLFKHLQLLNFNDIISYFNLVFTYKCLNGLSCPVSYFSLAQDFHNYNLRNINSLRPKFFNTSQGQTSPSYYSALIWNDLPVYLRNKPNINSFKYSLKLYLLSK